MGNEDRALELIEEGRPDFGEVDGDGWTPLMYACWRKMEGIAILILNTGRSGPTQKSMDRETALFIACNKKLPELALKLICADPRTVEQTDCYGKTPLMIACDNRLNQLALEIIKLPNCRPASASIGGRTALMIACERGLTKVVETLLETGRCAPGKVDKTGMTAITRAWNSYSYRLIPLIFSHLSGEDVMHPGYLHMFTCLASGSEYRTTAESVAQLIDISEKEEQLIIDSMLRNHHFVKHAWESIIELGLEMVVGQLQVDDLTSGKVAIEV